MQNTCKSLATLGTRRIRAMSVAMLALATPVTTTCLADELPPYAVDGAVNRPVIFAEGAISSSLPEFATAFSPSGDMVIFNRTSADRNNIMMMTSEFKDGSWTEPAVLSFTGPHRDVDPWFSSDGSRLYFSSNRPAAEGQEPGNWDTWYVERHGMEWSEPMRLGPEVNTEAAEIFVSVTDDGTLFFRRSAGENRAIYSARAAGDNFAAPEQVQGLELPSAGNPSIARDGSFLIMSGIVEGRASDLFISFSNGDGWTPAKNLGDSINTTFAEFAPSISPDGKYLFFTSERPGVADATAEGRPPGDIYQIELRAIEGLEWPE